MSLGNIVTTQVSTGTNSYVQSLLNNGWSWDLTRDIRFAFDSASWTAGEKDAISRAAEAWDAVANVDISQLFLKKGVTTDDAEIVIHLTTSANINGFGGYSGTPNQALSDTNDNGIHVGDQGQVHTYLATDGTSTSGDLIFLNGKATPGGFELIMHELGHALGLKHPHDYGSSNYQHVFDGVTVGDSTDTGDYNLNQQINTIMSYNYPTLAGECATPMAYDIAAIQQLYGARTGVNSGNNTYQIYDIGDTNPNHLNAWQCIWDTGGTDEIVYNGDSDAQIDLRPATLDKSANGGGVASYTHSGDRMVWRGFTIAGDIRNVIADVNGVTGVIIENAQGGNGDDSIRGNDVGNQLNGGGGDDVISAFDGDDVINGQSGHDFLGGGLGDDIYLLYDVADGVYDFIDERPYPAAGVDTVWVRPVAGGPTSYTLAENVENGANTSKTSMGFTLNGNELANKLYDDIGSNAINGGAGDDFIDGGAGDDTLTGGVGNDTLQGNTGGDIFNLFDVTNGAYDTVVEEKSGEGEDIVLVMDVNASVRSYQMTDNVENGAIVGHNASGFTLHGNDLGNKLWDDIGGNWLWGEGGDDTLDGGDGQDFLVGGTGDDTYNLNDRTGGIYDLVSEDADGGYDTVIVNPVHIDGSTDRYFLTSNVERGRLLGSAYFELYGNSGTNRLDGNAGTNLLTGYDGDDKLYGRLGNDTLSGGGGKDRFVFDTALNADSNVDTISDFSLSEDLIGLNDHVFKALKGSHKLADSAFHVGTAATNRGHHIIYNQENGWLSYDADGKGGGDAIHFATLSPAVAIDNTDFIVI